ncbi:MAG: RsmF rRNA methyltransferase first C-terminal domain-containing protein [Blautia sp.]|nr:RsmF rRNA methyltransferase first C-terminal domain-containing protein [Lachnoclostridium sp.]MCM1212237.1 RsmF rRNA methyltransferase first C-terminal domain-containing protein [Blautia sp.]
MGEKEETGEKKTVLPQAFEERMQKMLGGEYAEFLAAYEKERLYGLRFNPLKAAREDFLKRAPFSLEPVVWCSDGFYYQPEEQPGKHILHEAGAYYIQEPSAMSAAEVLAPQAGDKVLDLCAAPGGKSTQIAGKMQGKGLLVSNEIIPGRAKILSQNIERMGIANAVVCKEEPERLATLFPAFFDKILVDAPCSGEGMFRKDETAVREWSPGHVKMCADRQRYLLEQAAKMLKPGGVLVYSTCTFSAEENESVISSFVHKHREFSIGKASQASFFEPGRKEWVEEPAEDIEDTMRLWPHKIKGEGHFIAKLQKEAGSVCGKPLRTVEEAAGKKGIDKNREEIAKSCLCFLREELGVSGKTLDELLENGIILPFGEHIYCIPRQMRTLEGLKIIRPGLHLCTRKKNRFEPSHALALYLSGQTMGQYYEMTKEQAKSYLRGETFVCDGKLKGWTLLTMDGYSLGFGKAVGGQMKNNYPKGLRKQL